MMRTSYEAFAALVLSAFAFRIQIDCASYYLINAAFEPINNHLDLIKLSAQMVFCCRLVESVSLGTPADHVLASHPLSVACAFGYMYLRPFVVRH